MNGLSATTPGERAPSTADAPITLPMDATTGRPRRQAAVRAQAGFGRDASTTPRGEAATARKRAAAPIAQAGSGRVSSRSGLPKTPQASRKTARPEEVEDEEYDEGESFDDDIDWDKIHRYTDKPASEDSDLRSSTSSESEPSSSDSSTAGWFKKKKKKSSGKKKSRRSSASQPGSKEKSAARSVRAGALKALKDTYPRVCQRKFANLQTFSTVTRPEGWVYLAVKDRWVQEDVDDRVPRMIRETINTHGRNLPLNVLEDFLSRLRLVAEAVRFYLADTEDSKRGISMLVERLLRLIRFSGYEASCVRHNLIENATSREVAQAAAREDRIQALQLPSSLRTLIQKQNSNETRNNQQANNGNKRRFGRN